MLDDTGAYPRYREKGVNQPVTSRKFAEGYLREIGFPISKTDVALEAIDKHMFTSAAGKSPECY